MSDVLIPASDAFTYIHPVTAKAWPAMIEKSSALAQSLAAQTDFKAKAGQVLHVPDVAPNGANEKVVAFGLGEADDAALYRALPAKLPAGDYKIEGGGDPARIALAWALGAYRFDRYKQKHGEPWPRLIVEDEEVRTQALSIAHACALARDMINTPANDMGPLQIESIAREIAHKAKARIAVVTGDDLHAENYPAVHAVGRAATPERAPRMIEITWGKSGPTLVIIGKGVVFDTGGLDIKPSAGMRLMKKDMGGAAHALALGRMVMEAGLNVRLTLLVPVVENAISGDAMRPGDVIASRKGLTIEVGNTDAEGRLILADALTRADELKPDLTVDFATLTGAARMALGPQLPPLFTDDDALAADLIAAGLAEADPMWRLPLYSGYADALDSEIADIANDPAAWAQAGAVTAALFLKRFAPTTGSWVHFDIMAWNPKARPGHPTGGEAQALRAVFAVLASRYS